VLGYYQMSLAELEVEPAPGSVPYLFCLTFAFCLFTFAFSRACCRICGVPDVSSRPRLILRGVFNSGVLVTLSGLVARHALTGHSSNTFAARLASL
jgi:hypothetical protein